MKVYNVLGMMSGTSLDGLDLAYCRFIHEKRSWQFEIRQCTTVAYNQKWQGLLKNAIYRSEDEHLRLHQSYGLWLGEQAKKFIERHQLAIDFIASHGHTSHHRPDEGITFQLGNGQALADGSGQKVICDFRTLDVSLKGQGAPLVPIGDHLLLSEYDFCLNLGGISNISFEKEGRRLAYDIGLANMPLNHITQKNGLSFDKGGKLARSGSILPSLLKKLNGLDYYTLPYPKSTGYEWFSTMVKPLIDEIDADMNDLLHTFIRHNCQKIAAAIIKEQPKKNGRVLVTGGGALNDFFIATLSEELTDKCAVVIPPKKFIEYKEAMVFAFMGVLKTLGEINVLSSVTEARKDSCSGRIFIPQR